MNVKLLKYDQLLPEKGIGDTRENIARKVAAGQFPPPVVLSATADGVPTSIAWVESEIDAWILAKVAARDRAILAEREQGVAAMDATAHNARREAGRKGAQARWARERAKRDAASPPRAP